MPNNPLEQSISKVEQAWDALRAAVPAGPSATTLVTDLSKAMNELTPLAKVAAKDGAVAKYASYDDWARHYSNVRMTVVPFGITTAIAILAWGWDKTEVVPLSKHVTSHGMPLFPALGCLVLIATTVLMVTLTYQTYAWGAKMLQQARDAGISEPKPAKKDASGVAIPPANMPTGTCKRIRYVLAETPMLGDIPLWVCLVALIGVGLTWYIQSLGSLGRARRQRSDC